MEDSLNPAKRIKLEDMSELSTIGDDGNIRREARFPEEFLDNPMLFYPKPEFLVNTFIEDDTLLTYAVRNQNITAVQELIKAGVDPNFPNKKGVTPISAAAHKGNTLIMQALIGAGASVNALNTSGSTALIQASHFGHVEAVRLLLLNNALSDFANLKGTTALMRASQEGHVQISKLLIVARADVNRKNHEGMNALMLASQRGHADMVLLLIKAGASMDEQTSQGSTALMLACKRGHDKVAEVLVSMGAEIYMRDCRGRTARDTATRRQHLSLLCWLDTQVQIRRLQENQRKQRSEILSKMRKAYQKSNLHLIPEEERVSILVDTVHRTANESPSDVLNVMTTTALKNAAVVSLETTLQLKPQIQPLFPLNASSHITEDIDNAVGMISEIYCPSYTASGTSSSSMMDCGMTTMHMSSASSLRPKHKQYEDWMWPILLQKSMELPPGVFELIVEFLPAPRIWQWSLWRLRRRCKLAPQQAVLDICVILDEMLTDANIFAGKNQKTLLQRIARNPQIHPGLIRQRGIPPGLVEMLVTWSDVQSLATRTTEIEVGFKTILGRKLLAVAVLVFRWQRHMSCASKALGLAALNIERRTMGQEGDLEGMETTDGCGEDVGSDVEGLMDQDQDTETEMPVEGDADEPNDPDSDGEDDNNVGGAGHGHGH